MITLKNATSCSYIYNEVSKCHQEYARLQKNVEEFVNSDSSVIQEVLLANRNMFTNGVTYEQSVFLFLSISRSERVKKRFREIQTVCQKIVGIEDFASPAVEDIHVTIFTETITKNNQILAEDVFDIALKYKKIIDNVEPLVIHILGPKLTPNGGVILECRIYSGSFYLLRECARKTRNSLSDIPRVPLIVYLSVGYIKQADDVQLKEINNIFKNYECEDVLVYSDEICIGKTRNKQLASSVYVHKLILKSNSLWCISKILSKLCNLTVSKIDSDLGTIFIDSIIMRSASESKKFQN